MPDQTNHTPTDLKARVRMMLLQLADLSEKQAKKLDTDSDTIETLTSLFIVITGALRGGSDRRWEVRPEHPGFLFYPDTAGLMVAPFHLLGEIPSGTELADIRQIASSIRIGSQSSIYLSGSAVTLGGPRYVGDLDFCEYVPISEGPASIEQLARIAMKDALPVCTKIKVKTHAVERPWEAEITSSHLNRFLGSYKSGARGKADHITISATTGPVEATNVIVWTPDAKPDGFAGKHSFSQQEIDAGSGPTPWIPRRLNRPSSIWAYVNFLRSDIAKYRQERPIKALKRALSLAAFLMMDEHQRKILELGRDTAAFEAEAVNERVKLLTLVAGHKCDRVRATLGDMESAFASWGDKSAPQRHKPQAAAFSKRALSLIDNLLREIAEIGRAV